MIWMDLHFFSEALGLATSAYVLLPQPRSGAVASRVRPEGPPWPVLYLLHGLSDDHTTWMRRTSIERYAEAAQMAVIMPAVGRSWYQNMASGPRYWAFVSEELPTLMSGLLPIARSREGTHVAGLSMGGYGALRLALTFPDRFATVASLSGAVDVAARYREFATSGDPAVRREAESVFGGDPAESDADLFTLAQKAAGRADRPRLYQYCGRRDFLYEDNLRFRDLLLNLPFDLTYVEDDGDHQWVYWDRQIERVLRWIHGEDPTDTSETPMS